MCAPYQRTCYGNMNIFYNQPRCEKAELQIYECTCFVQRNNWCPILHGHGDTNWCAQRHYEAY